jgi:hypothetical protein
LASTAIHFSMPSRVRLSLVPPCPQSIGIR